ncbi:MAG: hypothetical protein WC845_00785 [Candidatus Staskawiczbacteria bacterium]|jgi:hypothetical protein
MKKTFVVLLISLALFPILASAAIVTCGPKCELSDVCPTIVNIITFIKNELVVALAILFLTIGGIVVLASGGSPELRGLGKKIVVTTIIGMALAFAAGTIIVEILKILGSTYNIQC